MKNAWNDFEGEEELARNEPKTARVRPGHARLNVVVFLLIGSMVLVGAGIVGYRMMSGQTTAEVTVQDTVSEPTVSQEVVVNPEPQQPQAAIAVVSPQPEQTTPPVISAPVPVVESARTEEMPETKTVETPREARVVQPVVESTPNMGCSATREMGCSITFSQ